jgi:hypothetical protein
MKKQSVIDSTFFKIALPMFVVWAIIIIARAGYSFGQWLYDVWH